MLKPREIKEFHIFLASPGDMNQERKFVRQFFKDFNRTSAGPRGFQFTVIDWENYSDTGIGRPQELITLKTLEKYRGSLALVIGLMGQRFGLPTGDYESGTEEEFEWALSHYLKSGSGFPEIKWFFRKIDKFVSDSTEPKEIQKDLKQWQKVQDFKKKLQQGDPKKLKPQLFFNEFYDIDNFTEVLSGDLNLWLNSFLEKLDRTSDPILKAETDRESYHTKEEETLTTPKPSRSGQLSAPVLGPIVGHTTDSSARIWIRAADDVGDRITVAIAALYEKNKYINRSARYFRLHREYDRTGITDFEKLKPGSNYTVRTASFALDSTDKDIHVSDTVILEKLPEADVWLADLEKLPKAESVANFRSYPAQAGGDLSFVLGSCFYRYDHTFDAIYEHLMRREGSKQPRFMLMVGDQMYTRMSNRKNSINLPITKEEFRDRYLTAFRQPIMRRLLRSVPHYMILNGDKRVEGQINKGDQAMSIAIDAYMHYQWSHSPRNFAKRLYYAFECAGFPFFVTDGRTQCIRADDKVIEDNHMLGRPAKDPRADYRGQIDILCEWLTEQQKSIGNRPKFIISASVFVPNGVDTIVRKRKGKTIDNRWKDDSWAAFPETRKQLLETIVEKNVQNVVFLSGDILGSNVAEMNFHHKQKGRLPLKAFSITSSAFYWPFTFADGGPLDYVHDSRKEGDGFDINGDVIMHYKAWDFEQDDNFTQVNIGPTTIMAETFNKKGESIKKSNLKLA